MITRHVFSTQDSIKHCNESYRLRINNNNIIMVYGTYLYGKHNNDNIRYKRASKY